MDKEQIGKITAFIGENKGKRKFTQSVELAVNFRGIDFNKVENRLNFAVTLPHGKGRESKVAVFADDPAISSKAGTVGARVINSAELATISGDSAKRTELLGYELMAQPSLMPQIARSLGQFLGPRNKMPKPVTGDLENTIKSIIGSIYIRSKGKYLPTVHCVVGTESMNPEQVSQNIDTVLNEIIKKVGKQNVRSVFLKLTMSKPIKLI